MEINHENKVASDRISPLWIMCEYAVKQIVVKYSKYGKHLHIAFVDYNKALDSEYSIPQSNMGKPRTERGYPKVRHNN